MQMFSSELSQSHSVNLGRTEYTRIFASYYSLLFFFQCSTVSKNQNQTKLCWNGSQAFVQSHKVGPWQYVPIVSNSTTAFCSLLHCVHRRHWHWEAFLQDTEISYFKESSSHHLLCYWDTLMRIWRWKMSGHTLKLLNFVNVGWAAKTKMNPSARLELAGSFPSHLCWGAVGMERCRRLIIQVAGTVILWLPAEILEHLTATSANILLYWMVINHSVD